MRKLILAAVLLLTLILPAHGAEFTDAKGRVVTLNETPRRTVALLGSYGEMWLEAGGTLVGTTEDAVDSPLAGDEVANLGSHSKPNMENLLALDPDFVILSADTAAHPAIGELLEQAGIPHGYFSVETWREYMRLMKTFTGLTGRADVYSDRVERVQEPIEDMLERAKAHPDYQKKTALLLRAYVTSVKAKGSAGTVAGPVLDELGLMNLADGNSGLSESLSMEAILLADPDYIFIVTMGADQEGAKRMLEDTLLSNPAWSTLTAVREGRCHVLDRELFHLRPNARWAESYEIIYRWLYETE